MRRAILGCGVLGACSKGDDLPPPLEDRRLQNPGVAEAGAGSGEAACAAGGAIVHMTTQDGVSLEGDLYTTGKLGTPGVVLLHMIPPDNTRKNFPAQFVSALTSRGLSVLNLDRRGAGGSKGNAEDAYTGPKGRLDAAAAVAFLTTHACGIDPTRIALVGASNGTATALDYAASAATAPRALVFLTGGTYTEAQTKFADHRPVLDRIAMLFVASPEEKAWSLEVMSDANTLWTFKEYSPGDHGTDMFKAAPQSVTDVADMLARSLGP